MQIHHAVNPLVLQVSTVHSDWQQLISFHLRTFTWTYEGLSMAPSVGTISTLLLSYWPFSVRLYASYQILCTSWFDDGNKLMKSSLVYKNKNQSSSSYVSEIGFI